MAPFAHVFGLALLGACVLSCGGHASPVTRPPAAQSTLGFNLPATDGTTYTLRDLLGQHRWTVLTFYSDSCPCVRAHDARLNELVNLYRPRGFGFYLVDSEAGASVDRDRVSALQRGYSIPILIDRHALLADAVKARYATHTVVLDEYGTIVYSGGIDSDKRTLHQDATPYLRNALDALAAGLEPDQGDHRALGCALER